MKTIFVDQLTAATGKLTEVFLVAQCDRKNKKDGALYLSLKLQDRTGDVVAKLWDVPEGLDTLAAGEFVKVEADTQTYKDQLQMNVKRIRRVDRAEVALEDFIPASKHNRDDLYEDVLALVCEIRDTRAGLRDAVFSMVTDNKAALMDCPAAKKLHQPYLGGLMEHILGIGNAALKICECYPQLDRDLLIAAAVVHDLGKLQELVWETHIGYSPIGSLVGHVTLGNVMFDKYAGALDIDTKLAVMHMIASHHGQLEWRAAVVPMTKEAFVFHLLDVLDARLQVVENAVAAGVDANGFTPFVQAMGTSLWNGTTRQPPVAAK